MCDAAAFFDAPLMMFGGGGAFFMWDVFSIVLYGWGVKLILDL